ncbi:hypothetical protein SUGI_0070330 [Cryptomeria japonica]|nr:hypothetical protein SUGI_0070330 [Cryptomeria japonica]
MMQGLYTLTSMRRMLDTMDWLFKDSFMFLSTQPSRDNMLRVRRPWAIMESDNELQIRFDLPNFALIGH